MTGYAAFIPPWSALTTPLVELVVAASLCLLAFAIAARPRRIYFVRHGQTEANVARVRQGASGPLSSVGRLQAEAAGGYLEKFPIRQIVASPFERAVETAHIINEHLKVPLSYSPLLVERRNPSDVIGKSEDDPVIERIMDQIDRIYHADDFRHSDEENFLDLKARAKTCLTLFSQQSARHLCAVTHGIYLKMLIAYLLYRDTLTAGDYTKLSFFNASDNAGITICEYEPLKRFTKTRGWRIVEYNVTPYEAPINAVSSRGAPRIPHPTT